MNKLLLTVILCAFALPAGAADDCAKADACSQPPKKASPFFAEVHKTELKQGATRQLELKQGKPLQPELKQGKPHQPELKPGKSRPEQETAAAAATAPAAAEPAAPAPEKAALVKPGWLLLMFALLAGVYYFLKEGKKRGKGP